MQVHVYQNSNDNALSAILSDQSTENERFQNIPYVMGCYDGSIRKLRILCLGLNGFEVEYIE